MIKLLFKHAFHAVKFAYFWAFCWCDLLIKTLIPFNWKMEVLNKSIEVIRVPTDYLEKLGGRNDSNN